MIKAAFVYLAGGVLKRAIPFLLLPVLTRYLQPDEYGTLAVFQVMLSFTVPFIGMNMQNNISRNFSRYSRARMARLVGTLCGVTSVTAGLVGALFFLWVMTIGFTFDVPKGWLLVLPIVSALSMSHQFNLTVLRNQQRPVHFGLFDISNTTLEVVSSLILVVGFGFGWQGRAFGIVIASICFGLVGLLALHRQKLLRLSYDRDMLREVLRVSLPLIPHSIGAAVITMSDRLFIDRMAGTHLVGIYAVGYTFGVIINIAVEAFNRAWSPWFYREMNNSTIAGKVRIVKITYAYFVGVLILAMLTTYVSYFILPFMVPSGYQLASHFILWIAVGYAFRGMYTMVFPYLVHTGQTSFLAVAMIITASINLALNFILIRMNGVIGAAQATLVAWVVLFLLTWAYAARISPMPWLSFIRGGR